MTTETRETLPNGMVVTDIETDDPDYLLKEFLAGCKRINRTGLKLATLYGVTVKKSDDDAR